MKKTENQKNNSQPAVSADLQKQRDYVKMLAEKKFEYGLVLANAFVKGMRDIGYKSTAFALDELIDNAIQAGARKVHVAYGYLGKGSEKKPDMLAVIDDGHGMDQLMVRASVIWGGTHRHNDRSGFGRYGYGLPSACVSIGRCYTVVSKVEGGDWHQVSIDLDEIEEHFSRGQGPFQAPEPIRTTIPGWIEKYLQEYMPHLKSGTVVLIEKIDRLDYSTTRGLTDFLLQEFGVTYRNFINEITIAVNGTEAQPTDPLFLTPGFRYYDLDDERAVAVPPLEVEVKDKETKQVMGIIKARFSLMPPTFLRPPEEKLKPKGKKKNARFKIRKENNGIIVLRGGRQIDVINAKCPWMTFQNNDRYVGIEIDFPPTLDEEFSITTSKQQIGLKPRIWDILEENGVFAAISNMRGKYAKAALELEATAEDTAQSGDGKRPSEAAIEAAQKLFAQAPTEPTPKQQKKSEQKLEKEAEELAEHANIPKEEAKKLLEAKAKSQPFKVRLDDMPGAPFYRMEQIGGQKVLFLNKAHRFYTELYASPQATPHVRYALEALLFVMGECEIRAKEERQMFYEQERQLWSVNLNTTLKALEDWNTSEDVAVAENEAVEAARAKEERAAAREVAAV